MSSRGPVPIYGNENLPWSFHLPSAEPITSPTSRKRPRGDESPRSDSGSTIDGRSRRLSLTSEFRGVPDTYTARERVASMGKYSVTIQDPSVTAEAEFERDDDGDNDDDNDTGGSPQTLLPPFRDAFNCINQELRNLDSFFLYRLRSDARRHVDDINEHLNIMEDSHRKLYSNFRNQEDQKKKLRDRLTQLKDQTEAAIQERDQAYREIEELKKTTARLKTSIKDFERDKMVLDSDSPPQSLSLSVPPAHATSVVGDAGDHHTHHKYDQLGFGITSFLSSLLKIELAHDQQSDGRRLNSVVTEYMFNLGSFADRADVAVSSVEGFWKLRLPWTSKNNAKMNIRPSIEERFAQLCLLIPRLKYKSQGRIWCTTVVLINALMSADHASAPHAGMAFLAAMSSTNPVAEVQNLDIQNVALAIALCELCRFLQDTFTELPQATWDISNILGSKAQGSVSATPLGRLSACLANLHGSNTSALRRQLAMACGDKFCFTSLDTQSGNKLERGLLSCDDKKTFLLLEFEKSSFRFVDRNFAYALQPEDQNKHLVIKRPNGEVLLDIGNAAQDVRVFWVKYVERP